mmetsp:Transcript_72133/g.131682  ORF Transcript_72133/g.131682 Transcript_72133/m.131682 type:complete len:204 (-) Transcript_72133:365-976(-)
MAESLRKMLDLVSVTCQVQMALCKVVGTPAKMCSHRLPHPSRQSHAVRQNPLRQTWRSPCTRVCKLAGPSRCQNKPHVIQNAPLRATSLCEAFSHWAVFHHARREEKLPGRRLVTLSLNHPLPAAKPHHPIDTSSPPWAPCPSCSSFSAPLSFQPLDTPLRPHWLRRRTLVPEGARCCQQDILYLVFAPNCHQPSPAAHEIGT